MSSRPPPLPSPPPSSSSINSTSSNTTSTNSTAPNRTTPVSRQPAKSAFEITPPIIIAFCLVFLLISACSFCYGYRCYNSRKKRLLEKQQQLLVSTEEVDKAIVPVDDLTGEYIDSGDAATSLNSDPSRSKLKAERFGQSGGGGGGGGGQDLPIPLAPFLQQSSSLPHNPSPLRHSNSHQQAMSFISGANGSSRFRPTKVEEDSAASFINQQSMLHHSRSQPTSLHPALTPPILGVGGAGSYSESSSFDHTEEDGNSSTKRLNRSFNRSPPQVAGAKGKATPRASTDKRNTFGGLGEIENLPSAVIGVSISRDMLEQALGGSTVSRPGKSRNNSRPNSRPNSSNGSRPGSRDGFVYESKRTPKLERKSVITNSPPVPPPPTLSTTVTTMQQEPEEVANVLSFSNLAMPTIKPIQTSKDSDWGLDGYFAELSSHSQQ